MSKEIKIGRVAVPVSEELHKEYYKMKRRERYMEEDVKVGRIDVVLTATQSAQISATKVSNSGIKSK